MDKHVADDPIHAALARDDPAAVELMWDRYARDLLAMLQAMLCCRHEAEDVLQAVFVKVVRKRDRLLKARCLDAYIYRIARNEAISYVRRHRSEQAARDRVELWLEARPGGGGRNDLVEPLQRALARLARPQREVVILKAYRDKTFAEIGRLLGISPHTAASRYRYGMEHLRSLLEGLHHEPDKPRQ